MNERFDEFDQKLQEYESLNGHKMNKFDKNQLWMSLCLPLCGWGAYIGPDGEDYDPYAGLTEEEYYEVCGSGESLTEEEFYQMLEDENEKQRTK